MKHGLAAETSRPNNDNRPKRKDRIGGYEAAESRVANQLAESVPQEKENNFVPNFGRKPKPNAEFFRARQSDSDPLSLGELRPDQIEVQAKETEPNLIKEIETNRKKELETNRQKELERNRQKELETNRQKEVEMNRKKELERNRQKEVEMNRKKELERNQAEITREVARPRKMESGKKTIFDELKNLDDGVFGEEVNFKIGT